MTRFTVSNQYRYFLTHTYSEEFDTEDQHLWDQLIALANKRYPQLKQVQELSTTAPQDEEDWLELYRLVYDQLSTIGRDGADVGFEEETVPDRIIWQIIDDQGEVVIDTEVD